jgi:hypothetical protein
MAPSSSATPVSTGATSGAGEGAGLGGADTPPRVSRGGG